MRFEDLTPAQQQLVKTDFGELDKTAAAAVAHVTDCYQYGFNKIAGEIIENLDKLAEDEKKEEEKKEHEMDEHGEKTAAESGAFIERGVFDRLVKEGSERHGDELHYFYPFMEQKIAEAGARAALVKAASKMETAMNAAKAVGRAAKHPVTTHAAAVGAGAAGLHGGNKFLEHLKKKKESAAPAAAAS